MGVAPWIVVVDDDHDAARGIAGALAQSIPEAQVSTFEDPRAALRAMRQHRPDLLISDAQMPFINGQELIGRLHRDQPGVPTILMSRDHTTGVGPGPATAFLPKPVTGEELVGAVRHVLNGVPLGPTLGLDM